MHLRRRVIMAMTSIAVVRWAPLPPPERRSCPVDQLFLAHGNPCTSIIAPLPRHQRIMAPVMMGSSSLLELHRALLCIRVAHAHWRAAPSSDSVPDVSCFHLWLCVGHGDVKQPAKLGDRVGQRGSEVGWRTTEILTEILPKAPSIATEGRSARERGRVEGGDRGAGGLGSRALGEGWGECGRRRRGRAHHSLTHASAGVSCISLHSP